MMMMLWGAVGNDYALREQWKIVILCSLVWNNDVSGDVGNNIILYMFGDAFGGSRN